MALLRIRVLRLWRRRFLEDLRFGTLALLQAIYRQKVPNGKGFSSGIPHYFLNTVSTAIKRFLTDAGGGLGTALAQNPADKLSVPFQWTLIPVDRSPKGFTGGEVSGPSQPGTQLGLKAEAEPVTHWKDEPAPPPFTKKTF